MKRIRAHILPLLVSVALLPPALAEAKTQRSPAAKSVRAATVKTPAKAKLPVKAKAKTKTPVQKAAVTPGLPDRNPPGGIVRSPAPEAFRKRPGFRPRLRPRPTQRLSPSSLETTAGLQDVATPPAPEANSSSRLGSDDPFGVDHHCQDERGRRFPGRPHSKSAVADWVTRLAGTAGAANRDRHAAAGRQSEPRGGEVVKGTIPPAIAAVPPALDYPSILKPILSYEISASTRPISGSPAFRRKRGSRIKDPAARDFALWYKYRNSKPSGKAEAIEKFRLAHPDWPGQDELREKAEAALFLATRTPTRSRRSSAPRRRRPARARPLSPRSM